METYNHGNTELWGSRAVGTYSRRKIMLWDYRAMGTWTRPRLTVVVPQDASAVTVGTTPNSLDAWTLHLIPPTVVEGLRIFPTSSMDGTGRCMKITLRGCSRDGQWLAYLLARFSCFTSVSRSLAPISFQLERSESCDATVLKIFFFFNVVVVLSW